MATPVMLPKLDMTMTQGVLARWHKQEGDPVSVGDPLFEVEADKVTMDIEATAAGVLRGVAYPGGSTLPVGTVVAYVLADGEALPEGAAAAPAAVPIAAEAPAGAEAQAGDGRVRATPAARRLGRERGVDLATVTGTGPNGRIQAADVPAGAPRTQVRATPLAARVAGALGVDPAAVDGTGPGGRVLRADVERAARASVQAAPTQAAPAPASESERVTLTGARGVIARRMSQSWHEAPHVTLTLEAGCAELVRLRTRLAAAGFKISYNTLVAFLTARSLAKFPAVNAVWDGTEVLRTRTVHLAVAVDTPAGLLVPVVQNADTLGLEALAERLGDLAGRARNGGLTPGELAGGTFTLSNLGGFGIEAFTPIINQPQVAILGVGAIVDKAVPVDGAIAIQPRMTLSLSFDHRALDGADGARFLAHLRSLIESPERALL